MILECKDIEYDEKTLSKQHLISVNFDTDTTLPSSVVREMEKGDMNKYRSETIGYGTKYSETLTFDLHICKDDSNYDSQSEMQFLPEEYDDVVSWLSSPRTNKLMSITSKINKQSLVIGYFSSIKPWDVGGRCYGIKCTFTCNSPFSYAEKKSKTDIVSIKHMFMDNESSELYDYVYPKLIITPTTNEEIFIHNLSDCKILDSGTLPIGDDKNANMQLLIAKITECAAINNSKVIYTYDKNNQYVQYICDNTATQFYMEDSYGIRKKYIAYYLETDGKYYICHSGFFYCKVSKDLIITIDCKNLGIYDSLGRPVLFNKIGIQDEDEIYWLRLIHGKNDMIIKGNFNLETDYLEPKKGMLI